MFPVLALAALSAWTSAAQPRTSAIPPISGKKAYRLPLPPYQAFCWFSADRGRWPGDGNRVLPWFGRTSPGNLLDSRPNPSTAKPGDHAMFALFHLKDGNFMAVLPVAAPDSLAWLKLERDGTFFVEAGSLGTSPAKPQAVLAVTATDKDIYRACSAVWNKALSLPSIKGRTLPREKKIYPEPFKYLGWCSWEQYKKNISSKLLEETAKNWRHPPSPSGGCWWTTDSRPRKGFSWSVSNPGRTNSPGAGSPDETQKPQIEKDGPVALLLRPLERHPPQAPSG